MRDMKKISFSAAGGIKLEIVSDQELAFGEYEQFLFRAYVPGFEVEPENKKFKADLLIKHVETDAQSLKRQGKMVVLGERWYGKIPMDFYHLLYSLVRVELLKQNRYCVHAGCVAGKKNILIVGHSGVGKTNTILNFLAAGKGAVYSGNKTVVEINKAGKLTAIAGTKTITFVANEANRKWQKLGGAVKYGMREAFILDEKYYAKEKMLLIETIVFVNLNDGVKEYIKLEAPSAMHSLYPFFMDYVNADTVIFQGKEVFCGAVGEEARRTLVQGLARAVAKIPVYKIVGSAEFILKSIVKL